MTLLQLLQAQAHPTPGRQKISFAGFPVEIEYPKGSTRTLKNEQGQVVYQRYMFHPYGFISNTTGRDGDEVDVILGPDEDAPEVYVAHMIDKGPDVDQREDEDKVFCGFPSYNAALQAFYLMYDKSFFGGMTALPIATFRKKLRQAQLPHREKKIHATRRRA